MKNLSIQSLTKVLTAKERAEIIAEYIVKGQENNEDFSHEINKIKMDMSSHQIKEFNFYMSIIQTTHETMEIDFQTMYLRLLLYSNQLERVYQQLTMSIYSHFTSIDINWLPKIVTKQGYKDLYEKQKRKELSAVFSIETLVEYEALTKLHYDLTPTDPVKIKKLTNEIKLQKQHLQGFIDDGTLKTAVINENLGFYGVSEDIGKPGITASSWYTFSKKHNQEFNTFIDDVDRLINFCYNDVAIIQTKHTQSKKQEEIVSNIIKQRLLKHLTVFEVISYKPISGNKKLHMDKTCLTQTKETLLLISSLKLKLLSYIEAVKTIESFYFNNTLIVSRQVWYAKNVLDQYQLIVQQHKDHLESIYNYYQGFSINDKNITFEKHNEIQFKEPTEKKVENLTKKQIGIILDKAIKTSQYYPRQTPID